MKSLLILFSLLLSFSAYQQTSSTEKIPRNIRRSVQLLSKHITRGHYTKEEKAIVIYEWITHNISYDYKKLESEEYFTNVNPTDVLKKRKAICTGYVELMNAMLYEVGIKSETISGYVHDQYWKPGKLTLNDTHAWIALEIDEEWFLADPTWDAGYIGRIRKNKKPYEPKVYKETVFKNKEQEEAVLEQRAKTEKFRKEKYEKRDNKSKKIGFVRDPKKENFLVDKDSFLLEHLPVLPMWQLRKNYISIHDFALQTDSLKVKLTTENNEALDFEEEIDVYKEKDYLDQILFTGEEGFEYNYLNPSLKALNYYNYLVLIHHKKIQKLARGSEYEITPWKYAEIISKSDTIVKYNKLSKTYIKDQNKEITTTDKELYKKAKQWDKDIYKSVNKLKVETDKIVSFIKTNNAKIEANINSIVLEQNKILSKTKDIDDIIFEDQADSTIIVWMDSLDMIYKDLFAIDSTLSSLREETHFNDLLTDVNTANYYIRANYKQVRYNTHSNFDIIEWVDSVILSSANHSVMLFEDSLRLEMLSKNVMTSVKAAKGMARSAKVGLKAVQSKQEPEQTKLQNRYLQAKLFYILKLAKEINRNSYKFNSAVSSVLKDNKEIQELKSLAKQLIQANDQKNDFIKDRSKTTYKRNQSLIKKLDEDSRKWKKYYQKKHKEHFDSISNT